MLNSIGTGILKFASVQKVSQTAEMVKGGSFMFKSGLNLIGT